MHHKNNDGPVSAPLRARGRQPTAFRTWDLLIIKESRLASRIVVLVEIPEARFPPLTK